MYSVDLRSVITNSPTMGANTSRRHHSTVGGERKERRRKEGGRGRREGEKRRREGGRGEGEEMGGRGGGRGERIGRGVNTFCVQPQSHDTYSLLYLVTVAPLVSSGSEKVTVSERLDVTWRETLVGGAGGSVGGQGGRG